MAGPAREEWLKKEFVRGIVSRLTRPIPADVIERYIERVWPRVASSLAKEENLEREFDKLVSEYALALEVEYSISCIYSSQPARWGEKREPALKVVVTRDPWTPSMNLEEVKEVFRLLYGREPSTREAAAVYRFICSKRGWCIPEWVYEALADSE